MSETVHFFGRVHNGQLVNRNLQQRIRELEGERFECTLRKRRSYRTLPQNAAFHGPVLGPITKAMREGGQTGFDQRSPIKASEVKMILKRMFLTREIINRETGEVFEVTKSDFADFLTQCIQWAEDFLKIQIRIGWEEVEEGYEVR